MRLQNLQFHHKYIFTAYKKAFRITKLSARQILTDRSSLNFIVDRTLISAAKRNRSIALPKRPIWNLQLSLIDDAFDRDDRRDCTPSLSGVLSSLLCIGSLSLAFSSTFSVSSVSRRRWSTTRSTSKELFSSKGTFICGGVTPIGSIPTKHKFTLCTVKYQINI